MDRLTTDQAIDAAKVDGRAYGREWARRGWQFCGHIMWGKAAVDFADKRDFWSARARDVYEEEFIFWAKNEYARCVR